MAFDYAPLAASALALLRSYGRTLTRRTLSSASYSVLTGSIPTDYNNTDRTGALFDFGAGTTTERGSQIQVGDKRLLLDATGPVLLTDLFLIDNKSYSVVSIGEISPAGTAVLYDLHLRS